MITDVEAPDANRADGLTAIEGCVMDALVDSFNDYCDLPVQHDDEPGEFRYHIHMLQGLLACRVARRAFPKGWTNDHHPQARQLQGETDDPAPQDP